MREVRTVGWRRDLVASLLAVWLTTGGFIDGFAHRNLDTPETFFTPWHGVLYTAYLAAVVFMVVMVRREGLRSLPFGYGLSALGLVIFAAGGVGDAVWHTLLGIEVGIDALLSPTHVLLLLGALLFATGPLRSRWAAPDPDGLVEFLPVTLSLTAAAAELGFFFQYADGLTSRFPEVFYVAGPPSQGDLAVIGGMAAIIIATVILMGSVILTLQRWRPPRGSWTLFFTLYGFGMAGLLGFASPEDLIAPVIGGVTADLLALRLDASPWRMRLYVFVVPVAMWSARFLVLAPGLGWPPEIWGGAILFGGLTGVGLLLLALPSVADLPQREPVGGRHGGH